MTHSYKIHFFHLIWSTKNREPLIHSDMQKRLYGYIGGIIKKSSGTLLEIGGMPNHIHLLINLTNLDKYSYFIRDIKSIPTSWVHKNFPESKHFAWQEGFASLSLHYTIVDNVKRYIQTQEEHHKTMSFEEEYLKILDLHHQNYDPRFVFG